MGELLCAANKENIDPETGKVSGPRPKRSKRLRMPLRDITPGKEDAGVEKGLNKLALQAKVSLSLKNISLSDDKLTGKASGRHPEFVDQENLTPSFPKVSLQSRLRPRRFQ